MHFHYQALKSYIILRRFNLRLRSRLFNIFFGSSLVITTCALAKSQTLFGYPNQVTSGPISLFNQPASLTFGTASSSCPMTTLGVSGFAANGDNWALFNNNYSTGRTGSGNYGITAGINMPLDLSLTRACRENVISYVRSQKLTNDANLVSACVKLATANVNLDDPDFKEQFPDVSLCQFVKPKLNNPGDAGNQGVIPPIMTPGKFDPGALPLNGFSFTVPQMPLIQTLPIQPR